MRANEILTEDYNNELFF